METVKAFNTEIASLYETKPPVSKAKMMQITKAAMKAIKFYKHVVLSVEKFIQKCKAEYKIPGLYVIDAIVRQSRHQFGPDKDVFGPRFARNLQSTLVSLLKCPESDRIKIGKVINLWHKNEVFTADVVEPLQAICQKAEDGTLESTPPKKPSKSLTPLAMDATQQQQLEQLDALQKQMAAKAQSGQAGLLDPTLLEQIQRLTSQLLGQNAQQQQSKDKEELAASRILERDYEYSDDSGDESEKKPPAGGQLASAAQNLLQNTHLLQQIQQMQENWQLQQQAGGTGPGGEIGMNKAPGGEEIEPPPLPPPSRHRHHSSHGGPPQPPSDHHQHRRQEFPPQNFRGDPNYGAPPPPIPDQHPQPPMDSMNYPPPAEPTPSNWQQSGSVDDGSQGLSQQPTEGEEDGGVDRDGRHRKHRSKRKRSKSRSRSPREKRHRHRSRSRSKERKHRKRSRSRSRERRDRDRERRKQGMPPVREGFATIGSRTLWFGRVPTSVEESEIREALRDHGDPVAVDLIPPRGCAYVVMPDRKSAFRVLDRLRDTISLQGRSIKMAWAPGKGLKEEMYREMWDTDNGVTWIPWDRLRDDVLPLLDGGFLDEDSLPENLKEKYAGVNEKSIEVESTQSVPAPPPIPPVGVGMGQFPPLPAFPPPGMPPLPGMPPGMPPPNLMPPGMGPGMLSIPPPFGHHQFPPGMPMPPRFGGPGMPGIMGVPPQMMPQMEMAPVPPTSRAGREGSRDSAGDVDMRGQPPAFGEGAGEDPSPHKRSVRPPGVAGEEDLKGAGPPAFGDEDLRGGPRGAFGDQDHRPGGGDMPPQPWMRGGPPMFDRGGMMPRRGGFGGDRGMPRTFGDRNEPGGYQDRRCLMDAEGGEKPEGGGDFRGGRGGGFGGRGGPRGSWGPDRDQRGGGGGRWGDRDRGWGRGGGGRGWGDRDRDMGRGGRGRGFFEPRGGRGGRFEEQGGGDARRGGGRWQDRDRDRDRDDRSGSDWSSRGRSRDRDRDFRSSDRGPPPPEPSSPPPPAAAEEPPPPTEDSEWTKDSDDESASERNRERKRERKSRWHDDAKNANATPLAPRRSVGSRGGEPVVKVQEREVDEGSAYGKGIGALLGLMAKDTTSSDETKQPDAQEEMGHPPDKNDKPPVSEWDKDDDELGHQPPPEPQRIDRNEDRSAIPTPGGLVDEWDKNEDIFPQAPKSPTGGGWDKAEEVSPQKSGWEKDEKDFPHAPQSPTGGGWDKDDGEIPQKTGWDKDDQNLSQQPVLTQAVHASPPHVGHEAQISAGSPDQPTFPPKCSEDLPPPEEQNFEGQNVVTDCSEAVGNACETAQSELNQDCATAEDDN